MRRNLNTIFSVSPHVYGQCRTSDVLHHGFLGWIHFPDHRVLRTPTKRRALRANVGKGRDDPTVQSYRGLLLHGNAIKLTAKVSAA